MVNAHGCGLIARRPLPPSTPVRVEITPSKRRANARVVDAVSLGGHPVSWLIGVVLDEPGNFWGLEYPPADWTIVPTSTPSAESHSTGPKEVEDHRRVQGPGGNSIAATPVRGYRLTDISAGACYLETATPFPAQSRVVLSIRLVNLESTFHGIVRVAHPHVGMGIEFFPRARDHMVRAEQMIRALLESREVPRVLVGKKEKRTPSLLHDPSGDPQGLEAEDMLLELIREGDALQLEEFQRVLKAQRLGKRLEPRSKSL